MQTLNLTIVLAMVLAIVIILFFILIYFVKGKDIFAKVIKMSFRYFIYILCVLAQQVQFLDGEQKKRFVVTTIKTIITKLFYRLHIPVRKVDDFIHKYFCNEFIENIVQNVYDEYLAKIKSINQSIVSQIKEDELYKKALEYISEFNE